MGGLWGLVGGVRGYWIFLRREADKGKDRFTRIVDGARQARSGATLPKQRAT